MSKIILGIDVSKATFDVALLLEKKIKTKKFQNKNKGFLELTTWLNEKKVHNLHICLEATGVYGEALAQHLFDAGHLVSVVNPARIKGFAQSELSRNKTDQADAQLIARFCHAMNPQPWTPPPQNIKELQALVRRLEDLQGMYYQETNRLQVTSLLAQGSIENILSTLDEEIKKIKKNIQERIKQSPDLYEKSKLLETIPGVGEATISQILAFIGNMGDFKNAKQLAAFIGLNPRQRQSGTSIKGRTRMSKIGSSSLRKAFYFPAITAKRHNPIIKHFCDNLKKGGKCPALIIGAAMRKLVHLIYGVLKSGKPFDASLVMA